MKKKTIAEKRAILYREWLLARLSNDESYYDYTRKRKELGVFKEKEKAIQARKEAEIKYFGKHRYDALNT